MLCASWDILSPLIPSVALMAHRFGWVGKALKPSEYLPLAQLLGVQASAVSQSETNKSETVSASASIGDFELISHHHIQNHFKFLHGNN